MRRYLTAALVYAALIVFLDRGMVIDPEPASDSLRVKSVPDFELPRLKDPSETVGREDVSRELSLLNVWASWCPACRQEHPYLVELASSEAIPIFGLNYMDDRVDALALLSDLGDPYTASAFDETGEVARLLNVHGAPQTFLIDSHGTILHRHLSPLTPDVWESEFRRHIEGAHEH